MPITKSKVSTFFLWCFLPPSLAPSVSVFTSLYVPVFYMKPTQHVGLSTVVPYCILVLIDPTLLLELKILCYSQTYNGTLEIGFLEI